MYLNVSLKKSSLSNPISFQNSVFNLFLIFSDFSIYFISGKDSFHNFETLYVI